MAFLGALQAFDKSAMKPTDTQVRDRNGKVTIFRKDGSVITEQGDKPEYIKEMEEGYSVLPAHSWSEAEGRWVNSEPEVLPALEKSVKFVTYNVWFSEEHQEARAHALFSILEDENADIICLQEVTPRFLELLCKSPWARRTYHLSDVTGKTLLGTFAYGVVLLTRVPVQRLTIHTLPSTMNRRVLVAEMKWKGESVKVATVHLESLANAALRLQQLSEIFELLQDAQHAFLMGDFNFDPSAEEQKALPVEYEDAWASLHPGEDGTTMKVSDESGKSERIDRVLCRSPSLRPVEISIIGKENVPGLPVGPSDHVGLQATFSTEV